jgi:hypothetical protein
MYIVEALFLGRFYMIPLLRTPSILPCSSHGYKLFFSITQQLRLMLIHSFFTLFYLVFFLFLFFILFNISACLMSASIPVGVNQVLHPDLASKF